MGWLVDRVYIIKQRLHDSNVDFIFKIGKSSGKSSVDRLMQLIRSHFMKYRYTPFMVIKRDRPVPNAFQVETQLHQEFKQHRYYHDKPIDGKDEWFYMREDVLLRRYDELVPSKKK